MLFEVILKYTSLKTITFYYELFENAKDILCLDYLLDPAVK